MPRFIRLASLTDKGAANVANLKEMLGEAKQVMARHGVTLVDAYVTLGHYDIIAIIEAPDAEAAAAVSALIAAQGNFRAETLPATPVTDFLQRLGSG